MGFEFFTVYVREPHPGENYTEHRSWEQKLKYARECREQDGIETMMIVDDLEGTMHRAYGEMPNMAYIIGKDGRVVYKSMWTDHADIEAMIRALLGVEEATAQGLRSRPSYTERISYVTGYTPELSSHVLGRAGPKAITDFQNAIGALRPAH
jgi:hypothetical protein